MPTAVGKSSYSCPPLDVYVKPKLGARPLAAVSPLYTSPAFLSVTVGLPPLSNAAVIPIFFLVTVDVATEQKKWFKSDKINITYTADIKDVGTYKVKAEIKADLASEGVTFSGEPDTSAGENVIGT